MVFLVESVDVSPILRHLGRDLVEQTLVDLKELPSEDVLVPRLHQAKLFCRVDTFVVGLDVMWITEQDQIFVGPTLRRASR